MSVLVLVTGLLSAALCRLYLQFAARRDIVDRPNHRSSHERATPHGGGLPLLMAFFIGLTLLFVQLGQWPMEFVVAALAAICLMLLGLLDDLRGLSVTVRLGLYAALCIFCASLLLRDAFELPFWPLAGLVVLVAGALLWLLNLYNFMDGIDGIAALQALLACSAAAMLAKDPAGIYPLVCLLFAAAHAGFLCWNWPPAKLFMGDTGSVPSGFLLGVLALIGWVQGVLNPLCWLILLALFIVDATWTLLARLLRGADIAQAHREHAYQRLSRHWQSHLRVDLLVLGAVVLWQFPIALLVHKFPENGFILVILAYLPWVIGMAKLRPLK